jgi:CspA family cold shock protein
MSLNTDSVTNNSSEHWTGRVKWFNNKAGYGFITITDGERSGSDIFVHHSIINVENSQYKYLVQGEYVDFDMVKNESGQHEWHASNVSGIRGGKLMCETKREFMLARNEYKTTKSDRNYSNAECELTSKPHPYQKEFSDNEHNNKHSSRTTRPRTSRPRVRDQGSTANDSKEWTLTTNKKRQNVVNTVDRNK